MKRSVIGWVALAVLAVGGAAFTYFWFSGGSGEPSTELTTPPIAGETTTTAGSSSTLEDAETTTTGPAASTAFVIQSDQSEASFTLNEVLRGSPQTVVGTTREVAGQIELNPDEPSSVAFSQIVVNARTFSTDSKVRDRAIRGPIILNSASDEFELITFDVTSVEGLDQPVALGEAVDFTLVGDLTIRGVTKPAEFSAIATLVDENTIEGMATTEVLRSDFEIGIPSVASVADVTDEVVLQFDFVATRA